MTRSRYTAEMPWGESLTISAELANASSPIHYMTDDGDFVSTPFQTADARHDMRRAMRIAIEFLGSDWYANPDDDRDDDEIVDDIMGSIDIDEDESEEDCA